jgi:hypothetical protein
VFENLEVDGSKLRREEFHVGSSLEVASNPDKFKWCQPKINGLALMTVAAITATLAVQSPTFWRSPRRAKLGGSGTVGEDTSNLGNKRRDERHLERRDAGESIEIGTVIDTVLCDNQKLFRNRLIANTLRSLVLSKRRGRDSIEPSAATYLLTSTYTINSNLATA